VIRKKVPEHGVKLLARVRPVDDHFFVPDYCFLPKLVGMSCLVIRPEGIQRDWVW
jgi:hypothetical protein